MEFWVHPLEVILWEVLLGLNTAICVYLLYNEKRREFSKGG